MHTTIGEYKTFAVWCKSLNLPFCSSYLCTERYAGTLDQIALFAHFLESEMEVNEEGEETESQGGRLNREKRRTGWDAGGSTPPPVFPSSSSSLFLLFPSPHYLHPTPTPLPLHLLLLFSSASRPSSFYYFFFVFPFSATPPFSFPFSSSSLLPVAMETSLPIGGTRTNVADT